MNSSFEEFWAAYPRKVGKEGARKVFERVTRTVDPALVVAGAARYATDATRRGSDPKFTAHPSTWLNAGRWDDEAAPQPPLPQQLNGRYDAEPEGAVPEEARLILAEYFKRIGRTDDEVESFRLERRGDPEARTERARAKARAMEDAWREQQGLDKGEEPERQRLNPGICAGTGKEAIREGDEWVCPDCKGPVTFIEPKAAKKAKSA
jgi:rubredoxin